MRKLLILFSLVFCLLFSSVNVFAADATEVDTIDTENLSTTITVTFKSGTGSYTVNGKNVSDEASIIVGGRVCVPVKVITDALGATLTVDTTQKTATIYYNGVEIKLTDKSNEAVVAGNKVKIDVAPYIKNSSFMAPISFLADTFGADLTNNKGELTFVKEIANPNSIKDFSTLIKKTTKNKIGDSYYDWSMALPDDQELNYRNFNGTENVLCAPDESYYVDVYIYDKDEDTSLDNAESNLLEFTRDYTLIDYGKKTGSDGVEFVEFIFKDDSLTYQYRYYLSAQKAYAFIVVTENDDSYLDDKYQNIVDSFKFDFDNDGSTEDLSDVTKAGYRKYQDTRLKWSINMNPEWEEYKDDQIQNKVVFNGKNDAFFSVEVYSMDSGETLDSITQDEIEQYENNFNSNLYELTKQESAVIGGVKCNKFYYTIKVLDKTYYDWVVCLADENYKYILSVELSDTDYNNKKQKALVEGMIKSFAFTALDVKTTGKLLDPDKVVLSDKTRNISEDLFSMDIPFNWIENETDEEGYKVYNGDSLSVSVTTITNASLSDVIYYFDQKFKNQSDNDFKVESKTTTSYKSATCYKYVLVYEEDGSEYRDEMYVMQKNGKVFCVDFFGDNLTYGPNNIALIDKMWSSFTLK